MRILHFLFNIASELLNGPLFPIYFKNHIPDFLRFGYFIRLLLVFLLMPSRESINRLEQVIQPCLDIEYWLQSRRRGRSCIDRRLKQILMRSQLRGISTHYV